MKVSDVYNRVRKRSVNDRALPINLDRKSDSLWCLYLKVERSGIFTKGELNHLYQAIYALSRAVEDLTAYVDEMAAFAKVLEKYL